MLGQLEQFIINHWMLWLALMAILVLVFVYETILQKKRAPSLSAAETVEWLNHKNAKIVDVRDITSFQNGHIIHSMQAAKDDFNKPFMTQYKDTPLILVCARGMQSATLATQLKAQGFQQVKVLGGGIASWQAANLPLVKGKD